MSLFGEKKPSRTLQEDVFQLSMRVEQLESRIKIAKLEAAEIYDKTLRLMQRMAKRYEVDKRENGAAPPEEVHTEPVDGVDPISRRILERRGIRRQAE